MPIVTLILSWFSSSAFAAPDGLDPMNRLHAGVSATDQNTMGAMVGFDSRLTRLVFIDVGGFISPLSFPEVDATAFETEAESVFLRHGLFVAPGLRLPHRDPGRFTWDVFGRGGFGSLWSVDTTPTAFVGSGNHEIVADPGLLWGLDVLLRMDDIGVRGGGKAFYYTVFSNETASDLLIMKPQWFGEVVYQW